MKIKKHTLWKLAGIVAIWGVAYLAGAFVAMGFLDQLTRAGIGG